MKKILLITFIIILIPLFMLNVFTAVNKGKFHTVVSKVIRVKDVEKNKVIEVSFEDYIKGVLAGEMPASFELEALKAQAVAARSYVLVQMKKNKNEKYDVVNTVDNQVYLTDDLLKEKWKDDYSLKMDKIQKAVNETSGEYLSYNNEVAEALFFSTSIGKTENSEDVFSSKVPYLRSVSSSWDESSPVFTDIIVLSLKDFYYKLGLEYNDILKIDVLEKTGTGRIKKIKINNSEFAGRDVVKKLSLRSNYFEISKDKENISIKTKGYGHGVGMSQYGAQGMAKEGYTYDKILKHYYVGTEIKKI
ncbi:MAG: stage II sporulation protein D [Bacilli bacterium]|nr:stage II sporulation protein D [Bacilli bacterium]